ncbi:MAG: toll/interleukin-1 receptor domain-containing protein [Pyrinomonadaceae bacterium]
MTRRTASPKPVRRAVNRRAKKTAARNAKQQPTDPSAYMVFISHSSKEKWIAGQLSKEIMALGAETWLDLKDMRGGDEIRRSIKRGIRASQEAIVLLSANSITSQWVIYEVAIADGQGKRITSILNNLDPDKSLAPLQGIKALDLNDFDQFLLELTGRIKKRLDKLRKAVS